MSRDACRGAAARTWVMGGGRRKGPTCHKQEGQKGVSVRHKISACRVRLRQGCVRACPCAGGPGCAESGDRSQESAEWETPRVEAEGAIP